MASYYSPVIRRWSSLQCVLIICPLKEYLTQILFKVSIDSVKQSGQKQLRKERAYFNQTHIYRFISIGS